MQDEGRSEETETLTISDLFVVDGVGFADLEERLLTDTARLSEVLVRRKRATDVTCDRLVAA